MEQDVARREFASQMDDFHSAFLGRTVLFLAAFVWLMFVSFEFRGFSRRAFVAVTSFEALCLLAWWLRQHWTAAARHGFVLGAAAWSIGLTWLLGTPLAMLPAIGVAQVAGAMLSPWVALAYTGIMVGGTLASAHALFPGEFVSLQVLLPPVFTLLALSLSLLWSRSLTLALAWAYHSTQMAMERLEETQQHRAELYRAKKDLEEAYVRLERANRMLILARAEAEEAREARNRFALTISHELRTPLNFILGFSEVMVNSPDTYAEPDQWPAGLYEDVQEIYRSSRHLLQLINDILDLGQIEARRLVLTKGWADLARIIDEVEAMVRPLFQSRKLWFQTEVEPRLPSAFVDIVRIRQVLLNLVTNSLRHTERGGVTVRLAKEDDSLVFCVQDTGSGIAAEDYARVFVEFEQLEQSNWRSHEGSGLGLPISRWFVELHGGRMWLESEMGQGSRFYFSVPLPAGETDGEKPASADANAGFWEYLRQKAEAERTVLVLSPDPAAGSLMSHYVEDYHIVTVAGTGQLPAKVYELLPWGLIYDRSSFEEEEIRGLVKTLPYNLPAIGFPFPGGPAHPQRLPSCVKGYLVKPVERAELTAAVRRLGAQIEHLLVVDDDPAMLRFVKLALESQGHDGYRLTTALTGEEALEKLRKQCPDALLLDLTLPDISGWQVLAQLQEEPGLAAIPVVILTAHDRGQATTDEDVPAFQLTLHRPLGQEELRSMLKGTLDAIRPVYPADPAVLAPPANPPG